MYVATIVISGDVQSGCNTTLTISNRLTSFESKLANFPGAVSLKALCDNWSDCENKISIIKMSQNEFTIDETCYQISYNTLR